MTRVLNSWKCRKLSLKGKGTVINNLALPQLLYVASVIHTPDRVFKEVKNAVCDFIWDNNNEAKNRKTKIAYNVLIQPIEKGGLKLTDFESKVKSLKAVWVKRFISDQSSCKSIAAAKHFFSTSDLNTFFQSNICQMNLPSLFYQDIFNSWMNARKNRFRKNF